MVATIVDEPATVQALPQPGFCPQALHIIQDNGALSSLEMCLAEGRNGPATAQLLAHHLGIMEVPAIITHCAPGAIIVQFHPTLTVVAAFGEPEGHIWERQTCSITSLLLLEGNRHFC